MSERPTVVVAIGGNALVREGQKGTFEEQLANVSESVDTLADLVRQGYRLVITHGNGPQVGNLYLRGEAEEFGLTPMPLDVCGAETQGQIGYIIEMALTNKLRSLGLTDDIVTVLTRVEVDPEDPHFQNPTKPVGPFYTAAQLEKKLAKSPFSYIEDSGRGFRRVVPSPEPRRILQEAVIRQISADGAIVIAAGGGGIPIIRTADGLYQGVEAVIDKDRTSALLAASINADFLLILTGVEKVAVNFNTPSQRSIDIMAVSEAAAYMDEGQFPPGSMGPKVESAVDFVRAGGGTAIITTLGAASAALAGQSGTRIVAERAQDGSAVSGKCRDAASSAKFGTM